MNYNKKIIALNFIFLALIALIPFLEFLSYNLTHTNLRTDLRVNFLTLKRLSFLYFNFIFILLIIFFIFNKKSRLKLFDVTIVLGTLYYLFFQYHDIKKILNDIFNLFERGKLIHFLKDIDGQISFTIIIIISLTFIYFIYKKKK
jgi:uncharacterized membrane protein